MGVRLGLVSETVTKRCGGTKERSKGRPGDVEGEYHHDGEGKKKDLRKKIEWRQKPNERTTGPR